MGVIFRGQKNVLLEWSVGKLLSVRGTSFQMNWISYSSNRLVLAFEKLDQISVVEIEMRKDHVERFWRILTCMNFEKKEALTHARDA